MLDSEIEDIISQSLNDEKLSKRMAEIAKVIQCISEPRKKVVEIGSYAGSAMMGFAEHFQKVYAVDPWQNGYDNDQSCSYVVPMERIEVIFDSRKKFHKNVTKIKRSSRKAVELFKDRSLDFVYIDGDHRYESVLWDISHWFPKVKKRRFIGGHDYDESRFSGVVRAVNEVFGSPDKIFRDGSWIKKKSKGM
jgi:hypothetical protein